MLALCAACSSQVAPLNKGGGKQTKGSGSSESTDSGAGGGSGASSGGSPDGSTANPAGGGGDGGASGKPVANALSTVKSTHKLDLLLMVDNSISMADKQQVLSRSLPDLIQRVADPGSGITDLHVGVVTSSLGGHGSTLCAGSDTGSVEDQELNDHGHLIATRPRFLSSNGALAPNAMGVLEWTAGQDVGALTSGVQDMVLAAGEFGCGLEAQLEAVQRFLTDPHPYQQINVAKCPGSLDDCAVPTGVDTDLLAQRAAFLRPDSAVAVVVLSDENDCSIQEGGQYYYAARQDIILPHGSSVCATNPNDACCYFCNGDSPPVGCEPDPTCQGGATQTEPKLDPPNLRCFHEKQRFGFDFLYPVQRYVTALTSTHVCTSRPDLVPYTADCKDLDGDKQPDIFNNPLFVNGNTVRDPSLVFFMSIVGVPYQDLAASSDSPLVYQTPAQLTTNGVWTKVLGNDNPGNHAPPIVPTDSLMLESVDPRMGQDGEMPPVDLAPPSAAPMANPVNGHEWNNSDGSDLQYSCIFPLPSPRDCAAVLQNNPQPGCDCKPGSESDNNPLCQSASGSYTSVQRFAKGYPGLRELAVSKALGNHGLTASICAANLTDPTQDDYGYRPAVDLLLNQIKAVAK
jgi:hypothetical protein